MFIVVLAIVGKTCSGKDTVAHYIEEKYGFKRLITYTTRPARGDDIQGVSHHFVTPAGLREFDPKDIILETKINGYEYFTLKSQLLGVDIVAILDPQGVADIEELGIAVLSMYVDIPESMLIERAISRGDDLDVVRSRLDDERMRFDEFRDGGKYSFYVNNSQSRDVLKSSVDLCMRNVDHMLDVLREESKT